MTLIVNEIHVVDGLSKSILVAAADRRLCKPDGSYRDTRRKLFRVPQLNATVSYFGVAEFPAGGRSVPLSSWLPNFINKHSGAPQLGAFAQRLRDELNDLIPGERLEQHPSGFHICGYNREGLPDLWAFLNARMKGYRYIDLKPQYYPPSSSFLERDARALGWDGLDPSSARSGTQVYRNGDFRAHIALWDVLDSGLDKLFQFPDFRRPHESDPSEYGRYVKFKFEVIAYVYRKWAKKWTIAGPIDVIVSSNIAGAVYVIEL
jgi:hypothetical protein